MKSALAYQKYNGGRYIYKRWGKDSEGNRFAFKTSRNSNPELQSTYLYNQDGKESLRYIRLDIDYEKSNGEFKTNGRLNWKLIKERIKEFPQIIDGIEYVTKSYSGKGLHILFGISPLPLDHRTINTQIMARQLQKNLIEIFNEIGIGADPCAMGLKQDFSTYRKKENLVFQNEILTRRIERQSKKTAFNEPFLTNLHHSVEVVAKQLEIVSLFRLYPDARVEKSFAKLFLYLMGLYTPKEIDLNSFIQGEKKYINIDLPRIFEAHRSIELKKSEVSKIMGCEIRTVLSYFKKEEFSKLFYFEETTDSTLLIGTKPSHKIMKLINRAQKVLASNGLQTKAKLKLIEPFLIQDGERNSAIVDWSLAYKWSGYSEEETFSKVLLRVKHISDFESSRSCKETQLKCTIRSVFSNRKELMGINKIILPQWLKDDKYFNVTNLCLKKGPITSSRSIAPSAENPFSAVSLPSLCFEEKVSLVLDKKEDELKRNLNSEAPPRNFNSLNLSAFKVEFKIYAVTFSKRIGFFLNGQMILCLVKNQHYKLSKVIPKLSELIGKEILMTNIIHLRRNTKAYPILASQLYKRGSAIPSDSICGKKITRSENMMKYYKKRAEILGKSLDQYLKEISKFQVLSQNFQDDFEIPF
jgi:hypothetical protein